MVVSTCDCSLQRRNQKIVEEAPAPFVTEAQHARLVLASKDILAAAGYQGVVTCEYLIGVDGDISFLEVNTRLQVEHPRLRGGHGPRPRARAVPHRPR